MASLNRVDLIGRVGKDPEVRTFENGNKIATFTLATSESYTDRNGERRELTEWHNIVLNGKLADLTQYFHKGSQLYISGKIRSRSWDDQNGQKRYQTEIHALTMQLLDPRQTTEHQVTQAAAQTYAQQIPQTPPPPAPQYQQPAPQQPVYHPPYGAVAQPQMPPQPAPRPQYAPNGLPPDCDPLNF